MSKKTLLHLIAFSYNANPIFIIVIVFTAFVPLPLLGIYIVLCLAASTLLYVLILRLSTQSQSTIMNIKSTRSIINELEQGRENDGRPIGKLLGDGIYESVQQLFLLGGIMLFASVVAAYLQLILPYNVSFNFLFIIDQHLASYALLTSTYNIPIILAGIIISLSFGGLTQLFITYGLLKQHKLSFFHFIGIRAIHTMLVCLLVFLNYHWLERAFHLSAIKPTFQYTFFTFKEQNLFVSLISTSSFITALTLLFILIVTVITTYFIRFMYKNKQA